MIYFLIALFSSTIGSLLGIGGGVIIVPVLLAMGIDKGLAAISSSMTVLVMACISCYVYWKRGQGEVKVALMVALGSIPGSYVGAFLNKMVSDTVFDWMFVGLLLLLLVVMLVKDQLISKTSHLEIGLLAKVVFGFFIGILSSLFGIGGGPIVVPVLYILFGLTGKAVSATSSYITLITTISGIGSHIMNGNHDMSLALVMIPGAIIGAQIGTRLNKKASDAVTHYLFICLLVGLIIQKAVTMVG